MDGDDEHDSGRGWEVVAPAARSSSASAASYGDDPSVFPPSLHEGLTPNVTQDSPSSSAEGLEENNKEEEEAAAEAECHVSGARIAGSARRLVESGIDLIRSKIAGHLRRWRVRVGFDVHEAAAPTGEGAAPLPDFGEGREDQSADGSDC